MIGELNEYLKDIIIWDKGYGQPSIQKQVLNRRSELILVFEKDYPISRQFRKKGTFDRGTLEDVWEIKREYWTGEEKTPTKLPAEIIKKILMYSSKKNDIVFDPFLGSGQVAVVGKMLDRRYSGFEIVKEYYNFAQKRLKKNVYRLSEKN